MPTVNHYHDMQRLCYTDKTFLVVNNSICTHIDYFIWYCYFVVVDIDELENVPAVVIIVIGGVIMLFIVL